MQRKAQVEELRAFSVIRRPMYTTWIICVSSSISGLSHCHFSLLGFSLLAPVACTCQISNAWLSTPHLLSLCRLFNSQQCLLDAVYANKLISKVICVLFPLSCFIYFKKAHLFEGRIKKRQRDISHLLILYPNGCNSCGWHKSKPGVRNHRVGPCVERSPMFGPSFPDTLGRMRRMRNEIGAASLWTGIRIWDVSTSCSGLSHCATMPSLLSSFF